MRKLIFEILKLIGLIAFLIALLKLFQGRRRSMKLSRYEVESKVNQIVESIAEENEVEKNFYGDCHPLEVMKLENKITLLTDEVDREELFEEIRKVFESYIQPSFF